MLSLSNCLVLLLFVTLNLWYHITYYKLISLQLGHIDVFPLVALSIALKYKTNVIFRITNCPFYLQSQTLFSKFYHFRINSSGSFLRCFRDAPSGIPRMWGLPGRRECLNQSRLTPWLSGLPKLFHTRGYA